MELASNISNAPQASGIGAAFANLKVSTKISLGFGITLAILLAVAATSYVALTHIKTDYETVRLRTTVGGIFSDIDFAFAETRRHVVDFADNGTKAEADAALAGLKVVRGHLDTGFKTVKVPARRQALQKIADEADAYAAGFAKVLAQRNELTALIATTLDPTGAKVSANLQELAALAARSANTNAQLLAFESLQNSMQLRLNFNKFVARKDDAIALAAKQAASALEASLAGLDAAIRTPDLRKPFDETAALATKYVSAYEHGEELVTETDHLVHGEMKAAANEAAAQIAEVRDAIDKELEELGAGLEAQIASAEFESILFSVIGVVLGLASALLIGRVISRPVIGMTGAMRALAGGDKSVAIPGVGRKDEIGQMAETVQVFKDNMIKAEQLEAAEKAEQVKREERTRKIEAYIADFDKSVASVLQMVSSASTELQATAQSMSATAEETSKQATAVAAASEQATTNVQTVASAAEELSSSISEISRQVTESSKVAGAAAHDASRTNAEIKGLAEAAQRIGDVVNLITDIASQTNLLALNATIEAARAGEAGKGFAVVASEVKSLATQTAKATEEISAKITEMQAKTAQSVTAIDSITNTIDRINAITTAIAAAVEEQGAATQEIARNVAQASAGTSEVSSNILGVTQAAADTGAASSEVLGAAGELAKQSEVLRGQVGSFLSNIRAA